MSDNITKPNRSYNDILRAKPSGDEFGRAMREAIGVSDRASALLFASHINNLLLALIVDLFVRDDDELMEELTRQGGPLSTLSNKINLAFATGLISEKTRKELDVIRRVRNAFAHSALSLEFKEHAIRQMCLSLDINNMHMYLNDGKPDLSIEEAYSNYSPEKRNFCVVSLGYIDKLQNQVSRNLTIEVSNMRKALDWIRRNNITPDQLGKDPGL